MQGPPDARSAGYHGYWVTDFTQIDPHFGTNEQLKQLIDAAHARGIKVFFDIITNHTADVIAYEENRYTYVPKDTEPFRTANGTPFDDRDYAGTNAFPALDKDVSFPLTPYVPQGIESKTPAWLNDLTLYHNRGDTTFTGEDSLYGDFFGLDDLFTEHPQVVDGMIDIYETWVRDMRIDGFRIDTMKHVNDEFWQQFSPAVLQYAKDVGKPDFFMFGEVADGTRPLTSHYTTHNQVQSVLDFPFQEAARAWVSKSGTSQALGDFFVDDDYYTDADSNAYQLPTFLGNHDAGHIGMFLRDDNPAGTSEDELLARDKLAHGLMYLSRGNPVVYFGDEQGYTGAGNDQAARQDLFKSVDLEYDNQGDDAGFNDNIGSPYTPVDSYNAEGNFWTGHPLYREIAQLARLAKDHPALRDGAQQHRYADTGAGVYAFSRIRAADQREYVVALNNAETAKTAAIPTWMTSASFDPIYGANTATLRSDTRRRLTVTVPPLSAVVYRARGTVPASAEAPEIAIVKPRHNGEGVARMEVEADLGGDSFYEVSFQAKIGDDPWEPIGTDDNAPYRVFHDVYALEPGTSVSYRAVVLDNAGHTRASAARSARVGEPRVEHRRRPARTDRDPRHHQPGAQPLCGHRPAQGRRRAVDGDRLRRLLAGLHRHRHADRRRRLPRGPGLRLRHGHQRGGERATAGDRPLPAPGRRLPRLGRALLGRGGGTADGLDRAAAAHGRRRVRRGLRGADRGPVQAVELHRPPPVRGQRAHHPRAGRQPLVRPRRAQRDLAQAGRPGGLLHAAAGMS